MLLLLLYSLEYRKVSSSSPLTKAAAQRSGRLIRAFPLSPLQYSQSLDCHTHQMCCISPPSSSQELVVKQKMFVSNTLEKNHCLLQKGQGSSVYQSRDCLSWTPARAKLTWAEIICKNLQLQTARPLVSNGGMQNMVTTAFFFLRQRNNQTEHHHLLSNCDQVHALQNTCLDKNNVLI